MGRFTRKRALCVGMLAVASIVVSPAPDALGVTPTFSAGPGSPLGLDSKAEPVDVAAGDFNGDGIVDLVTANQSTDSTHDSVSVLLGTNGLGAFAAHSDQAINVEPSHPTQLAVGDLNGDGRADVVVVASGLSDSLYVLLGTASGLGAPTTKTLNPSGGNTNGVALGDVNGDGKLDVLVTNGANVDAYPGNGKGGLGSPVTHTVGCGTAAFSVAFGDATGDGKPDIVAACLDQTARVLPGNGAGTYGAAITAPTTGNSGATAAHIAITDMNGDGKPDLLLPDYNVSRLAELFGRPDGSFAAALGSPFTPATGAAGSGGGTGPNDIALGDVNGDGFPDVVMDAPAANAARVLLNDGSGGFDATPGVPGQVGSLVSVSPSTGPEGIALADLNGDGRPDVVTGNFSSHDVSVLLNNTPMPGVRTNPATGVGQTAATLNGIVNPEGSDATYRFEYGNTTAYGNQTPVFPIGGSLTGTADQAVSAPVTGLTQGATYHFRLVAINGNGTTFGRDLTFKAGTARPAVQSPPTISGNVRVGKTVTCAHGRWTGDPRFTYKWSLNGRPILGQTRSTLKLSKAAAAKALQCTVTATNAGGSVSQQSNPVVVFPVTCKVPNVVGLKLPVAKKKITSQGCKVGHVKFVRSAKKGHVISQSIPPGTKVLLGTKVYLVAGK